MADCIKIMNLIGGVCGFIFALLGLLILIHNLDSDMAMINLMRQIARAMFLIFFGLAAGVIKLLSNDIATKFANMFGFIRSFTGSSIYFLVMGMYVYTCYCNGQKSCIKNKDGIVLLGVVAAITSIVIGAIMAVLRITTIREDCQINVIGTEKRPDNVDYMAAVASCGLVLMACQSLLHFVNRLMDFNLYQFYLHFSSLVIILTFGLASLISALRVNPFVAGMFGFLYDAVARGVFYLLIGFWTLPMYMCENKRPRYSSNSCKNRDLFDMICLVCSIVSIAVGVVIIILGCRR